MAVRYVLLGGESPGLGMLAPHVSNNYFGGILGRSSLRLQLGTQGGEQRAAEQQRAPQSFKSASCLSRMISSPTTTRERERDCKAGLARRGTREGDRAARIQILLGGGAVFVVGVGAGVGALAWSVLAVAAIFVVGVAAPVVAVRCHHVGWTMVSSG